MLLTTVPGILVVIVSNKVNDCSGKTTHISGYFQLIYNNNSAGFYCNNFMENLWIHDFFSYAMFPQLSYFFVLASFYSNYTNWNLHSTLEIFVLISLPLSLRCPFKCTFSNYTLQIR